MFRSPFTRKGYSTKSYSELPDTDISYVSSGRPSIDRIFPSFYDSTEYSSASRTPPRLSSTSDLDMGMGFGSMGFSFESLNFGRKSIDITSPPSEISGVSFEADRLSSASHQSGVVVS